MHRSVEALYGAHMDSREDPAEPVDPDSASASSAPQSEPDNERTSPPARSRDPYAGTGWTEPEVRRAIQQFSEATRANNDELARQIAQRLETSGILTRLHNDPSLARTIESVNQFVSRLSADANSNIGRMLTQVAEASRLAIEQAAPGLSAQSIAHQLSKVIETNPAFRDAVASIAVDSRRLLESGGMQAALQRLTTITAENYGLRRAIENLSPTTQAELHSLTAQLDTEDVSTLALRSLGEASPEALAVAYERLAPRRAEFASYAEFEAVAAEVLHEVDPTIDLESTSDETVAAQESLIEVLVAMDADGAANGDKAFSKEVGGTVGVGTVGFALWLLIVNPTLLATLLTLVTILELGAKAYKKTVNVMEDT